MGQVVRHPGLMRRFNVSTERFVNEVRMIAERLINMASKEGFEITVTLKLPEEYGVDGSVVFDTSDPRGRNVD